jgi:hypothetical protein
MGNEGPLLYVDVDGPELDEFPVLTGALAEGREAPLVLVGDEIKTPAAISMYWIEDELAGLGVAPFADVQGDDV